MAEFCLQCAIEAWGYDTKDFAGLSTPADTREGQFPLTLCEGCGVCQVDHNGRCISDDCEKQHGRVIPHE